MVGSRIKFDSGRKDISTDIEKWEDLWARITHSLHLPANT